MLDPAVIGWLAAAFTLLTFSMRSMLWLRICALGASLCFIAYGTLVGLAPVVTLHVLLLTCNMLRLCQVLAIEPPRMSGEASVFRRLLRRISA